MGARSERLIFGLDLAGTALLGVQGAEAAMASRLDLLGVLTVAFVTALGGAILRDLLIGAAPPAPLRDWRYPATAFAAGLSLLAVAGADKTLNAGLGALTATLMGAVTGVGGGAVGDLLLMRIPAVLRTDIYATAALAGAAVMIVSRRLRVGERWAAGLGAAACFSLRLLAVWLHWNLPSAA